MSMSKQVNNVKRNIYFQLRRIRSIRCHLDQDTCAQIIHALVTSRLDFNNGLLAGLPAKTTAGLQVAQNSAARLLTGTNKREHITPHLARLHWLPVHQRVKFKTLCLIHKALNSDTSPVYMSNMITQYSQSRELRSTHDSTRLSVSRFNTTYGHRQLTTIGAEWWNILPISLRSEDIKGFLKGLKTVLFQEHFEV